MECGVGGLSSFYCLSGAVLAKSAVAIVDLLRVLTVGVDSG